MWGGGSVLGSILLEVHVPVFTIHALSKCKEDIVSTLSFHYTTYMHYIKPNKNNIIQY